MSCLYEAAIRRLIQSTIKKKAFAIIEMLPSGQTS